MKKNRRDSNQVSVYNTLIDSVFSSKKIIVLIMIFLALSAIFSGIYTIEKNEVGVHLRFGKVIDDKVAPGIHYAFFFPIDEVYKIPVKQEKRIVINEYATKTKKELEDFNYFNILDSYLITGDNNIAKTEINIQYKISNPAKYIFNINAEGFILKNIVKNSIIEIMAKSSIDKVLVYGKLEIQNLVKKKSQEKLDKIESGIQIVFIQINYIKPPTLVQENFDDVINAKNNKKNFITEAYSYKNENIPLARISAEKEENSAQMYKNQVISEAQGKISRFNKQLEVYANNSDIVKRKIYIDSMKKVLSKINKKFIVNEKQLELFMNPK